MFLLGDVYKEHHLPTFWSVRVCFEIYRYYFPSSPVILSTFTLHLHFFIHIWSLPFFSAFFYSAALLFPPHGYLIYSHFHSLFLWSFSLYNLSPSFLSNSIAIIFPSVSFIHSITWLSLHGPSLTHITSITLPITVLTRPLLATHYPQQNPNTKLHSHEKRNTCSSQWLDVWLAVYSVWWKKQSNFLIFLLCTTYHYDL